MNIFSPRRHSRRYLYIVVNVIFLLILLMRYGFFTTALTHDDDADRPNKCDKNLIRKHLMHDKRPDQLFKQKPVRSAFTYQLTNGNFCTSVIPHAIIFVISKSSNFDSRNAIRRTWGNFVHLTSVDTFSYLRLKLLFLIDIDEQHLLSISLEQTLFHDIVQVHLPQHYSLSTYRDMSILHWTDTYCSAAMMTVKTDDDIFLNTYLLANIIDSILHNTTTYQPEPKCDYSDTSAVIYGHKITMATVVRRSDDPTLEATRYIVTNDEYPCIYYPDYMSGFAYIVNRNARSKLLCTFLRDNKPFGISDVYVTGILPEYIGIERKHLHISISYQPDDNCEEFFSHTNPNSFACASSLHYTTQHVNVFERFNVYWKRIYQNRVLYNYENMKLARRHRRLYICLFMLCTYASCGLIFLYSLHYIWCATKDSCTDRLFCPRRQMIFASNITAILDKQYSLCSVRSARRGPHQRVIGVSAYLSKKDNRKLLPKLQTYLLEYIKEAKIKYPEWIVRVYYYSLNLSKTEIFDIEDNYTNVDFCDSTNIPGFDNVLDWLPGKIQRFLPLVDPLVDVYMSRDIDSPILDRETAIVNAWLNSKHTIHIIRDHPEHDVPILGGLWGIKSNKERSLINNVSQYLLSPDVVRCYAGTRDQTFLQDYIWPHAEMYNRMTLEFDSFTCERFPNSRSFLTRKELPTLFVGCRRPNCTQDKHEKCPEKCRPDKHQDWIWC